MNNFRFLQYPLLAAALLIPACAGEPESRTEVPTVPPPEPPRPQIYGDMEVDPYMIGDRIFFDFDSAAIRPDAEHTMKEIIDWLDDHPDVKLLLEGHTDPLGSEIYNLNLGCRRAEAAKEAMIGLGLPAERMQLVSYNEYRPAFLGKNEKMWPANRRVVFVLMEHAQGFTGPNCNKQQSTGGPAP